ncbi:MAG: TonB-dependent receptor [Bacteroidia bacterium]|nr:TonB-dependent receptor [Bacteroidia bacterium]
MNKCLFVILIVILSFPAVYGQNKQNIKGRILDRDSKAPLFGVTVKIQDQTGGAITDEQGFFKIQGIDVGRYTLVISYIGYEDIVLPNIIVSSGKETYLPVEMIETAAGLSTIVISNTKRIGSYNDMATLSSRTFNADEAEKYPGSRQDPARMASNYAGVQGTDDSRNDIVVRGNSPLGLLWRFEGIDIPNPSHFSIAGTTGGPLSILNNKVIGHSDFMTGAFPGEYGNALSGVFDIKMRSGNREKYEHTAQIGVLGLEFMSEGPINKKTGSSYIATYRYSTFAVFEAINFRLGTDAIPNYQDASFKLNFPMKNNANFSVWGIGGLSNIDIVFSDDTVPTNDLYGENDRDQFFKTNMFTVGATYNKYFKNEWSSKVTIAQTGQEIIADHDFIIWDSAAALNDKLILDDKYPVLRSRMFEGRTALHWALNKKFSARSRLKLGLMADMYQVNYIDSSRNEYVENWVTKLDAKDNSQMIRTYASHKFRLTSNLTMNSGLNFLYYSLGSQFVVEPRLGLKLNLNKKSSASLAYGLHSRMQPMYTYYYKFNDSLTNTVNSSFNNHNYDLGLTKSHHLVGAYDIRLSKLLRLKVEAYYQYLYAIPVESRGGSFSLINQGSGFSRFFPDVLENTGTGQNYGTEITIEKFFSKKFFFLTSASLFNSTYQGKDEVTRNTDFNGNYIVNILGGYEIPVGKNNKNSFSVGTKLTYGGGRRYTPVDTAATRADGIYVQFVDSERNSLQFPNYFRWDVKLGYKINGKKATHEFALDLLNVTNHQNLLTVVFANDPENPGTKKLVEQPQLAFLPLLYYKIDF